MKNTYTIKHPFLCKVLEGGFIELEIQSENLIYTQLGLHHHGLQCENQDNHDEILKKCSEICKLILEIDKLNNP